jgi:hypothetical protein
MLLVLSSLGSPEDGAHPWQGDKARERERLCGFADRAIKRREALRAAGTSVPFLRYPLRPQRSPYLEGMPSPI